MATELRGADEFNSFLKLWSEKLLPNQFKSFQKKIALDILRGVVLKTPVDTGRARANWQLTIGKGSEKVLKNKDKPGEHTINKGLNRLASLGFGQAIFITNNVSYIVYLEEGKPGPGSEQAPNGMLALTLEEVRSGT